MSSKPARLKNKRLKNKEYLLSVVIPAYRAEKFIEKNLREVMEVLKKTRYPYEIICVVDGKVDRTYEAAKKFAQNHSGKIRVTGYKKNLGKGHAVRFGMAKTKGDIVAFIDAGGDLNPQGLSMMLAHFEWYDSDIIVGSKWHSASKVNYSWQRKVLSIGYRNLVKLLFGMGVRDTQVGLKLFKREVLEKISPRLLVKAFAFDIEMLAVAHHLGFTKIHEAPVESKMELAGSTIVTKGFLRTVFWMLWDTLAVFYRLRILGYYNDENRKNWVTTPYLAMNNQKR